MRPDMAKVIVERPRYGSALPTKGKGYNRRTARFAWEDQPKREGIKVRGCKGKSLNEHLAPLRRYLTQQVGRPWDKIFADVCRFLDRNSAVQDHVRDHLEDYVATRVIVHDGQLCQGNGRGIGRPLDSLFYVCPRTGILKRNPNYSRWRFGRVEKLTIRFLEPGSALVSKDGVWHNITTEMFLEPIGNYVRGFDPAFPLQQWDALMKKNLYREEAVRIYGCPIYAVAVRRASKREVRQVVNSYPHTNVVR
jgi:hypothetical protein